MHFTFYQLADKLNRPPFGEDMTVQYLSTPEEAGPGDMIFLTEKKFLSNPESIRSRAWLIAEPLLTEKVSDYLRRSGISYIPTPDPKADMIALLQLFYPEDNLVPSLHKTAVIGENCAIHPGARIDPFTVIGEYSSAGNGTHIHANCVIGRHVQIGDDVLIYPNVTVYDHSIIGNRSIIHAGTVIGGDGFGYMKKDGRYIKIPHAGKTVIEDDVEIGANCCIDRGTLGVTHIRRGSKLDNLIQIAHNVVIGEDTVIAAQAGIAGSAVIGDSVTIAGQAGLVGHIAIGSRVTIGAQAGVIGSVEEGKTISGYPARDHHEAMRREALISKIPEILETLKKLKPSES